VQISLDAASLVCEESVDMTREQDARRSFRLSVIAIIVSGAIGVGNLLYQMYRDRSNRTSAEVRFGKIETSLRLLTGTVAPQLQKAVDDSLKGALSGDQGKAKSELEFARTAIKQLREANVSQPSAAFEATSQHVENLVKAKADIPETWATAAEFISYRSALTHEDLSQLKKSLPRCVDMQPHPATTAEAISPGEQTVKINPAYYENCQVELDSPGQDAMISLFAQKNPALTFRHCLVIYKGGIVRLQLGMWPLMFENCLWEFSVSGTPPASGQKVTETLLAGNLDSFKFPPL